VERRGNLVGKRGEEIWSARVALVGFRFAAFCFGLVGDQRLIGWSEGEGKAQEGLGFARGVVCG